MFNLLNNNSIAISQYSLTRKMVWCMSSGIFNDTPFNNQVP